MTATIFAYLLLFELGTAALEGVSISNTKQTEHPNKPHINHHHHIKHRHHQRQRHHHQKHRQQTTNPGLIPPESTREEIQIQQVAKCFANPATMELCQRCASVTKSEEVFPLCCSDIDGVQGWCVEYLDYGRDKVNS